MIIEARMKLNPELGLKISLDNSDLFKNKASAPDSRDFFNIKDIGDNQLNTLDSKNIEY